MQAQVVGRLSVPQLFGPQFITHSIVLKSVIIITCRTLDQCSQLREVATLRDKLSRRAKPNEVHYNSLNVISLSSLPSSTPVLKSRS